MAVPVFEGAGTGATTTGTTLNVPFPASISAGDYLILHTVVREPSYNVSGTPSGFTLIDDETEVVLLHAFVYGKVATGSETGNLTVSWDSGGGVGRIGRIYRFSGVDAGSYEGLAVATDSGSTTCSDVGVTTTGADRLALNLVAYGQATTSASFTGETGGDWTEATAEYTGSSLGLQLQTAGMASSGTINGGSMTLGTSSRQVVHGLALVGAAAAAATSFAYPSSRRAYAGLAMRGR